MKATITVEKIGDTFQGSIDGAEPVEHADLGWLLAHLAGRVTSTVFNLPPRDFAKEVEAANKAKAKADRYRREGKSEESAD